MLHNKAIERILESFDFEKVHAYMILHKWTYRGDEKPPTIDQLYGTAAFLLSELSKSDREFSTCNTGGFLAVKAYNQFHLYFYLESVSTGLDY